MPKFFIPEQPKDKTVKVAGDLKNHILKSLRMKAGDNLILCDGKSNDYQCIIKNTSNNELVLEILNKECSASEPTLKVHLYQALPKGNKFETIIQKSVELGVNEITPVLTSRCISRPDDGRTKKKIERWNSIAKSAAEQSGRGIIPKVNQIKNYSEAIKGLDKSDVNIIFYECGGTNLSEIINDKTKNASIIIGSEGGFSPSEIELAKLNGVKPATLGKRILRCETAPLSALSILMFVSEN